MLDGIRIHKFEAGSDILLRITERKRDEAVTSYVETNIGQDIFYTCTPRVSQTENINPVEREKVRTDPTPSKNPYTVHTAASCVQALIHRSTPRMSLSIQGLLS